MFCCSRKKRKRRVSPLPTLINETFEESIVEELTCGTCRKHFTLNENQLNAICGGCNQFLHCGIAGSCIGPNCNYRIGREIFRQSWCKRCVPKTVIINLLDMGEGKDCLCQECLDDPETPNAYKKKI